MAALHHNNILDDIFEVLQKDPDGKKFDRVSRFVCHGDNHGYDMALDINIDLLPLKVGDKFAMHLVHSIYTDGTPDSGLYDENFPTVSRKESYMDAFDYVMYGLVYKYAHEGGGGGSAGSKEGVRVCVYVSFGGLLMKLKGDAAKLSVLDVDSKVYLCIASV